MKCSFRSTQHKLACFYQHKWTSNGTRNNAAIYTNKCLFTEINCVKYDDTRIIVFVRIVRRSKNTSLLLDGIVSSIIEKAARHG